MLTYAAGEARMLSYSILLCVLILLYMCPHSTICVLILLYVSSYYYICVLILLYSVRILYTLCRLGGAHALMLTYADVC
jgi:hypothetical protein